MKKCETCGVEYKPLRQGRCSKCYQYWRRHGTEHPTSIRKCECGACPTCKGREKAQRHRNGVIYTTLASGRFQEAQLRLPSDPATLGYIAGILDGEGCITTNNKCWRVQVAMTDYDLVAWLGVMGGTVRERKTKGNRQRTWLWLLNKQADVAEFLLNIMPHLRVKRARAQEAIASIQQREVLRFSRKGEQYAE